MANGKIPTALHDMYKTNGLDRSEFETHPGGPSMTRQEFSEECDINAIMKRYDAYMADPMRSVRQPVYYDFTTMPETLMEAMDVLHKGSEAFYRLPAQVRKEFDNNAAAFVDFASDPANLEQMREWGLGAPEKAPDAPVRVEVVETKPAASSTSEPPKADKPVAPVST